MLNDVSSTTSPSLSVAICSHEPREDYLREVLEALRHQTLPTNAWELILVDNASRRPIRQWVDASWHPRAVVLEEPTPGKNHALLRAIERLTGNVLVIVDDDNVLNTDYLETATEISKKWPMIGAWGGQALPRFESEPPQWMTPYLPDLMIRTLDRDLWCNLVNQYDCVPAGAGMCVRTNVARAYAEIIRKDRRRLEMARSEDLDMAFTACDLSLGLGLFKDLKLTHLIPSRKLTEEYFLSMAEGNAYAHAALQVFRGGLKPPQPKCARRRLFEQLRLWRMDARQKRFFLARERGYARAVRELLGGDGAGGGRS